jgi:hypothetical protein
MPDILFQTDFSYYDRAIEQWQYFLEPVQFKISIKKFKTGDEKFQFQEAKIGLDKSFNHALNVNISYHWCKNI